MWHNGRKCIFHEQAKEKRACEIHARFLFKKTI
jgi:hypothetical protein